MDTYYPTLPTWAQWAAPRPTATQRHDVNAQSGPTYTTEDIAQHVTPESTRVCDIHNGGPSVDGPVDTIAAVGQLGNGEVRCLACLMSEYYYSAPHADGVTFAGFTAECAARMDGAK